MEAWHQLDEEEIFPFDQYFGTKEKTLVFTDSTPAKNILQSVISYLKRDWNTKNTEILKMMMDLQLEGEDGKKIGSEERSKFAKQLHENSHNILLHIDDKSNRCRYSEHIINISISLYFHSKSEYSNLRDSVFIRLPSPRLLRELSKEIECYPGKCPNTMFMLNYMVHKLGADTDGHLMMDKIKLKNEIIWNYMNNEVI